MPRAFVIRPFDKKKDSAGAEFDFERVHKELITEALKAVGFDGGTTGEIVEAGNIREDMFGLIVEADLVVCDVTVHNANVFYELGIRNALRKRNCILIRGNPSADTIPFDLLTDRYLKYPADAPEKALGDLTKMIQATLDSDRETDSPVFKMLPGLPAVDPATVQVVPADYTEEVERALASKSPGWVRLLADDVSGMRFQWPALKLAARAQVKLKDYEGARASLELIRQNDPKDISADLALANVYERLYRAGQLRGQLQPELAELSNQAIARVLNNEKASASDRAEARALKGRNLKTLWRLQWEPLPTLAERRQKAIKRILRESYAAYLDAYLFDLNHYWSGLAALQLGTLMLELATEPSWRAVFKNQDEAKQFHKQLLGQVESLRHSVALALDGAEARLAEDDKERVWVEITRADLMFLSTATSEAQVISAYDSAVPAADFFAWDAAKGQLQLFANIGFRTDVANAVMSQIDARFVGKDDAMHVVIVTGHRIDGAGRPTPRFPANRESEACALIRQSIEKLSKQGEKLRVLASAAPGTDIICHEVCGQLNIKSTICLPMPNADFARNVFAGDLDSWRSRFLDLVRRPVSPVPVLNLSSQSGLPRWLKPRGIDPWERGNRWVLEMALASGAQKMTLIALWDGKLTGDASGGTAHMVQIARDATVVDVVVIDAKQLVS
jgi:hypothetical protein